MSLDRKLKVTIFPSQFADKKKTLDLSLNEIADKIESTSGASKDKLPWLKLGKFGSERTNKNSLRSDANFEQFDGVEVDYDGGKISIKEATTLLKKAGIAAIVYTSASHTPEAPRFRVLCPVSETKSPKEREHYVKRLNGIFDGQIDAVSFTKSQSYYYGAIEGKSEHFAVKRIDGDFLDEATHLDKTALGKRKKQADGEDGADYDADDSGSGGAYRKALSMHLAGGDIEEFAEWATENEWNDYAKNPERAVERTWERAGVQAGQIALAKLNSSEPLDFEDISEDDERKTDLKSEKKERLAIYLHPVDNEDLSSVPPLKLWYGTFCAPGWLSAIISPGGSGKSALSIAEALAMASGVDFLGPRIDTGFDNLDEEDRPEDRPIYKTFEPLKVGLFNFEDDRDTMRRRIAAARQHHGISHSQVKHNLFYSGTEQQIRFAYTKAGDMVVDKRTEQDIRSIVEELGLQVLYFDPWVSMSFLDENSNSEQAQGWGRMRSLAQELGISINVAHHSRKGTTGVDLDADSARGASAIRGVVRSMRVVNKMQKETAEKLGITDPWRFIRIDDGKLNHAPVDDSASWRRLASVEAEGHEVSTVAVEHWAFPETADEPQDDKAADNKQGLSQKDFELAARMEKAAKMMHAYAREKGYHKVEGWAFTDEHFKLALAGMFDLGSVNDRMARMRFKKDMFRFGMLVPTADKRYRVAEPEVRRAEDEV
jgi:hypothetical protein